MCEARRDIPGAKHSEGHLRRRGIWDSLIQGNYIFIF